MIVFKKPGTPFPYDRGHWPKSTYWFYPHTGRIPEEYRKKTWLPLSDPRNLPLWLQNLPLSDPRNLPLSDPRQLWGPNPRIPQIGRAPGDTSNRKRTGSLSRVKAIWGTRTDLGLRARFSVRGPWGPRPDTESFKTYQKTCIPEEYRKSTGRIPEE